MKTRMLLNKWVVAIILAMASITNGLADTKVTSLDQLTAGTTIRIYPYGQGDILSMALACNGNNSSLTSLSNALDGEEWTLIDAGDGYFYLKNELGCYWAYQDNSSSHSLTCTTDVSSAVAISMTWDNKYNGVCFWNKKDGKGLNNLNRTNNKYNWYSNQSNYDGDSNTTFEVYVSDGEHHEIKVVEIDGLKLFLDSTKKTASVISNDYRGDIVVPQSVDYEGTTYAITTLNLNDFKNCTSIDARYCDVGDIGEFAFGYSNFTSVSIGNVGIIGGWAFRSNSNLTSVSIGNVGIIGERAFDHCSNLTSVSIDSVGSIGGWAFESCDESLFITIKQIKHIDGYVLGNSEAIIKCYVENPEDIEATSTRGLKRLFVPKSALVDYKNTSPWSSMANRIYPIADIPVTQIVLPETAHIKEKGEEGKIQLVPTFYPANVDIKTVEWKSSDENIVKVDENGYVTGVNMGEANIIVTSLDGSEKSDTCKVTVGAIDPEAITFVGMPTEVYVGSYIENVTKKVKVTPEDADYSALTITTSDKDVLRYYNTDKILAKSIGTAQVIATLTLTDGSELSTSCDINVVADPAGIETASTDDVKVTVNGNLLSVEGLADGAPLTVASVQGSVIYHGTQHSCALPGSGIYLVKVGGKTMKVIVK